MSNLSTLVGIKVVHKGNHDASGGLPTGSGADDGSQYQVSVAGTLSGQALKVGDQFTMLGGAAVAIAGDGTMSLVDTNASNIGTNTTNIGTVTGDLSTHEGLVNPHLDWTVAQAGKEIELTNLPASVQNGLVYIGTWNAATNTPTLADGTGAQGNYYRVSVAGTQDLGSGSQTFAIDDRVVHDGSIWQKWDTTDQVTSVHGRVGTVVAVASDYDADQIDFVAAATSESAQTEVQGILTELELGDYIAKAAAFTAKEGNDYACDSGAAAFTVTMPVGAANKRITFLDMGKDFATNNVTLDPTVGQSIGGAAADENFVLDVDGALVELVYSAAQSTWLVHLLN